jgi:L-serine deaminase
MSGLTIRLNEAQLLRAGMPKESVVALREIIKIIGAGVSTGDISDMEGLIVTAGRPSASDANDRQEIQRLHEQIGMIRRDVAGQLSALRSEIDAIGQSRRVNLSEIINRIEALEGQVAIL